MAIFESTAFLSLKKSFGNVTTYRLRGINVLRMKTKEIRDPRTSGQRIRRVMLAESARLSCGFQAAHRLGFPKRPLGETTFNTFVRLNMAAVKVDDGLTVATDFSALVCSQGSRKVPAVKVTLVGPNHFATPQTLTPKPQLTPIEPPGAKTAPYGKTLGPSRLPARSVRSL